MTATREIHESLPEATRVVHYVDIETASDSGRAALGAIPGLVTSGPSVWNAGQVPQLLDVEDWLSGTALPEGAFIQASLGDGMVTAPELGSLFRRICSAPGQTLVVTLGSNGAAWADEHNAEVVPANPIPRAFTLGAGAVLSGALVMALVSQEPPSVGAIVPGAVAAATQYVRDATSEGDMHGLDFW